MRALAWLAAGGVCLFAVSGHLALLNFRVFGLILLMRGGIGLWLDLDERRRTRCKSFIAEAVAHGTKAFESLTAELARDDSARVSLAELLTHRAERGNG